MQKILTKIYDSLLFKRSELGRVELQSIRSLSVKKRLVASVFAISMAMFAVSYLEKEPVTKVSFQGVIPSIKSIKTTSDLESEFKHVERFNVNNSKGTVIFVPQIHKEPTTSVDDPKNDRAVFVQKEMYTILNELVDENGIKLVMDETDLYGPLPQDKVKGIQDAIKEKKEFQGKVDQTLKEYLEAGGSQETANNIKKQSEEKLAILDRNLYLTGSAAVLEASNPNAVVYGSQNAVTINEARKQLQNIVFMENRIAQLEGDTGSQPSTQSETISQKDQIKRLLSQIGQNSSQKNIFLPIKSLAKQSNNDSLNNSATELEKELSTLVGKTNFETKSTTSQDVYTSNPYQNTTNLAKLKSDYNKAYDRFMLIAKDQRSQEAADNTIRMMNENNENTGILVLGAQHQDQLVNAFNSRGYNVIVITPESVINKTS